jgi:uncharacterized MAPEG superfamily protein
MLTSELSILALYGLLVAITLLLQASGSMSQLGMGYLLSSRDEGRTASGIAARLDRALSNSVTAMALFAPAVLIIALREQSSQSSVLAAQIFLLARVVYLPAYAFKISGIRTLAWTIGFFATILLYFMAL